MTELAEIFQPGLRHAREQRDFDKILVVEQKNGGPGPQPLDLESGTVTVVLPSRASSPDQEQ